MLSTGIAQDGAERKADLAEGSFGVEQGIRLWLQLDAAGYMHLDLPYKDVRGTFERALAAHLEQL
jgi:hypothetical protein